MLSVSEALTQLLAAAVPIGESQKLPVRDALNHVLSDPLVARTDTPAFDNSAMDGYALRIADITAIGELPVAGRCAAGQPPVKLEPGAAKRIFTGAPIPEGADAVCKQENCEAFQHEKESWIRILEVPEIGANIRHRGEDFCQGVELIKAGTRLLPQHLGLCYASGNAEVKAKRPLRVAIFSTGNELIEPDQELQPGQIYNSNQVMLEALSGRLGCEVVISAKLPDDPLVIRESLMQAASQCDLILSSGGVSVGDEDHMKAVVQKLGKLDFWGIAVKPGKPLAFGSIGDCGYLGLPGNPVSSFVTFCLFAAPYIRKRQGESKPLPKPLKATALNCAEGGAREEYLRGILKGGGVEIFAQQGSHLLGGLNTADCLVCRPAGASIVAGDEIEIYLLGSLQLL